MEDVNNQRQILFLFLSLNLVPWNSASEGFAYNWQSKWVGIIAIKTERSQIHFLSDVVVAVASLDLKSLLGSLRNDDDDRNEKGSKATGLHKENNNFERASRFFVHLSAVVTRLQRETGYFHVFSRTGTKDNNFLFLFLNFDAVL